MANLNFILFLAFSSLSLAQNQELPVLPDHYSTKIQANIILTERGKIGPGAGISYAFDEAANGDEKAYLAYKVIDGWQMSGEYVTLLAEAPFTLDSTWKLIWDQKVSFVVTILTTEAKVS